MSNQRRPKESFFSKLMKNKNFKRFALPITVVIIGAVLIITAPWQAYQPNVEDPTPTPTIPTNPPPGTISTPTPTPDPDETPTPDPGDATPKPTPTPLPGVYNPLTGEPWHEEHNNRPWAVSIGNTSPALPQHGLASASILYEYIVEGTETRILAIFQNLPESGIIGSIRSARQYIVEIANSYDALLVHAGGRDYSGEVIAGSPITRLNTLDVDGTSMSYRDQYRRNTLRMSNEHTLMTTYERLTNNVPTRVRLEHEAGYSPALGFKEDGTPSDGKAAERIDVRFIEGSKTSLFTYSAADKLYFVRQHSRDMVDGNSGTPRPGFTNLLILQTDIKNTGDASGRRDIRTTGEGNGYFMCGGKYIEITWSRTNNSSQYVYRLKDGSLLEFGIGKTYICIISSGQTPTIS